MACKTEITPGTILGNLKTRFEGSIPDFLKNHKVSEDKAANYKNATFCPVEVYHGIPYAEPPVGENAFKKTKKFSGQFEGGVKDCKNYGKVAIQDPMWAMMLSVSQLAAHVDFESAYKASQDCLTLDVYKPQVEGDKKLPVFVWIHGGSFKDGSAIEYNGELIASLKKHIVVIPQYRLGLQGFFQSNNGLYDVRTALEWVNSEIAKFGGDPKNVHICGESAGAAISSFQLNYDAVQKAAGKKQLFQKVTTMSGAGNAGWSRWNSWQASLGLRITHDFLKASEVGYDTVLRKFESYTVESITEFLKTLPDEKLIELSQKSQGFLISKLGAVMDLIPDLMNIFSAVIDNEFVFENDKKIDYSGYKVTYGMINGDGILFQLFMPMAKEAKLNCKRSMLSKEFYKSIENSKFPEQVIIELYEKGLTEENVLNCVTSRNKLWADETGNLKAFVYSDHMNFETFKNYPQANIPVEHQMLTRVVTDDKFTIPMLENMIKVRESGGKVRAYELQHGMKAFGTKYNKMFSDPKTGQCFVESFWENGYNVHGDDMCFLFGVLFGEPICKEGKSMKDWGLGAAEYEMTVNFMDFVFGEEKFGGEVEGVDRLSLACTVFDVEGETHDVADFRRKELEMRNILIPSVEVAAQKSRRVNL